MTCDSDIDIINYDIEVCFMFQINILPSGRLEPWQNVDINVTDFNIYIYAAGVTFGVEETEMTGSGK